MPHSDPPSYKSYLLRLWRAGPEAGWQYSLQDTATGEDHRFADVAGMTAFLQEFADAAARNEEADEQ